MCLTGGGVVECPVTLVDRKDWVCADRVLSGFSNLAYSRIGGHHMDENERLIKTKEHWAKARRGGEEREVFYEGDDRLPPGQHVVETFPVLDLGHKPEIALSDWTLTVGGFVANPVTWTWEQFLAQPQVKDVSDFHCVTSWSRFDNEWEGVSFRHILTVVQPLALAKFVLFKSYD